MFISEPLKGHAHQFIKTSGFGRLLLTSIYTIYVNNTPYTICLVMLLFIVKKQVVKLSLHPDVVLIVLKSVRPDHSLEPLVKINNS